MPRKKRKHRGLGFNKFTRYTRPSATLLTPDGKRLGACDYDRGQWYLNKGIAELVSEDPFQIRLLFEPANREEDKLLKVYQCVVCGTKERLSGHHVVPWVFLRSMPKYCRSRNAHDILVLCVDCHIRYDKIAFGKLKNAYVEAGLTQHGYPKAHRDLCDITGLARSYLKHKAVIPEDRQQWMLEKITQHLGHPPSPQELQTLSDTKPRFSPSKSLVEQVQDYDALAKEWREHFVTVMQPPYLPSGWSVDRKYSDEKKISWLTPIAPTTEGDHANFPTGSQSSNGECLDASAR